MEMAVILYTSPGCFYCMMLKRYLVKNTVKFREVDISEDEKAKKEMEKKSGQSNVPVMDINGTIIKGYDLKGIKKALGIE